MSRKKAKKRSIKGNKEYSIPEVFEALGEENLSCEDMKWKPKEDIRFDGYLVHPKSLRYMTFYQKGTCCCKCGREGAYFTLDKENPGYEGERRHFNLYAEDGTLMTKDHIFPRGKGGCDTVENMQTMCAICNDKKGAGFEFDEDGHILGVAKKGKKEEWEAILLKEEGGCMENGRRKD